MFCSRSLNFIFLPTIILISIKHQNQIQIVRIRQDLDFLFFMSVKKVDSVTSFGFVFKDSEHLKKYCQDLLNTYLLNGSVAFNEDLKSDLFKILQNYRSVDVLYVSVAYLDTGQNKM